MAIPIDPRNLADTAEWVKSLFPNASRNWGMRKPINLPAIGRNFELVGGANDAPENQSYGTVFWRVLPERRKGAHDRAAELSFYVHEGILEWVNLKYTHARRNLYVDWEEEPPNNWSDFLKQGEALNHRYRADPTVDRDVSNIQNLDLFRVFGKSPLAKILGPLYEETIKRLFATVEHHELHTDTGAYDEGLARAEEERALALAEEERALALTESYDPSLDLGPLTETNETPPEKAAELERLYLWAEGYARAHKFNPNWDGGVYADHLQFEFTKDVHDIDLEFSFESGNPFQIDLVFFTKGLRQGLIQLPLKPGEEFPKTLEDLLATEPHFAGQLRRAKNLDALEEVRQFYDAFIRRLYPEVEHHELHTDVGGYDESKLFENLTKEEYRAIKVGEKILYQRGTNKCVYTITYSGLDTYSNAHVLEATDTETGERVRLPITQRQYLSLLPPVGHEELHTDVGGYDESLIRALEAEEKPPPLNWQALTPEEIEALKPGEEVSVNYHGHVSPAKWQRTQSLTGHPETYAVVIQPVDPVLLTDPMWNPKEKEAVKYYPLRDIGKEVAVAHEELHTDVGAYDEARAEEAKPSFDLNVYPPPEAEMLDVSTLKVDDLTRLGEELTRAGFLKAGLRGFGPGNEILYAYRRWIFSGREVSLRFGLRPLQPDPSGYAHGFFSADPSYLSSGGGKYQNFGEMICDIDKVPLEYPVGRLPRPLKGIEEALREAYRGFIDILSRFATVEHHELHTDVGSYDESLDEGLSLEQFHKLKKGDVVDYLGFDQVTRWTILRRKSEGKGTFSRFYHLAQRQNPEFPSHVLKIKFYEHDRENLSFPPTEHEELHTDVGPYDESTEEAERLDLTEICANQNGYYRLTELLKEAGFRVSIRKVLNDLVLRAYKEIREKSGFVFGVHFFIAPETFRVGPSFYDGAKHMEFVDRSLVLKRVPAELPYKIVSPSLAGAWSPHYHPDEAIPEFRKIYTQFLQVITSPVAHEELHGDLSGYDESIGKQPLTLEQWDALEPGDSIYYKKRDTGETFAWHVLSEKSGGTFRFETTTKDGKPMQATFAFVSAQPDGEWYPDLGIEHSELHTDVGPYDEAVEKDRNIEEALGSYSGPEFNPERWQEIIAELRHELGKEISIREDNEGHSRTVTAYTEEENLIQFNRGAFNSNQLIQSIVSCVTISPSMGVHVYGDEIKTGAEMPESIEKLLDFHDAYYVGGPGEKQRGLGKPEPGERDFMLENLQKDPEYPALARFYEEFIARLFGGPEHHELHTDTGAYDESLLKEAEIEEERYYGIATGDGNSGVSRMSPDYIVLTDKPWDLADLAAFAAFKDDPVIQKWVGKNMEIDGDSDYGIQVVFPESPETQEERKAAAEEYERRREAAEAAGEEFEEEDPSEEFVEEFAWFIMEIFPIEASEIDRGRYRCEVYDKTDHPEFLEPLYPIIGHEELHTDVGGYDEALIRRLKEAREVKVDSQRVEEAVRWAKERWPVFFHETGERGRRAVYFSFSAPEDIGLTLKTKPSASVKFQFARLPNQEEHLVSMIVNYKKPQAYSGGPLEIGIIDIVEGYPIPTTWEELEKEIVQKYGPKEGKFVYKFRRLKFFPQIKEAFEGFVERIFAPVEHEELHTDVGSYDESKLTL